MENITADGKIKTIRCVKATHEDFAKLVNLGKDAKKELQQLEQQYGYRLEELQEIVKKNASESSEKTQNKTFLEIYIEMIKKSEQLFSYHNAYHVLMEEGVNELLATIGIAPDSYGYDFYQLCLDN